MTRPVHHIDTTERDYEFVSKDPWVLQFRAAPKEQAHMRKPRSLISTKTGGFKMENLRVAVQPGPPVDGKLLIQVSGDRI